MIVGEKEKNLNAGLDPRKCRECSIITTLLEGEFS